MTQHTDIADAVVAALNAGSFSMEFTATRAYIPRFAPKDVEDLTVTVILGPHSTEPATRGSSEHDYVVMVGVQKKLTVESNAEIDALMALVEEVMEALQRPQRLTGATAALAACIGAINEEPFLPEHVTELRVFTSFITVTYRLVRV